MRSVPLGWSARVSSTRANFSGHHRDAFVVRGHDDFAEGSRLRTTLDDMLQERLARDGMERFARKARAAVAGGNHADQFHRFLPAERHKAMEGTAAARRRGVRSDWNTRVKYPIASLRASVRRLVRGCADELPSPRMAETASPITDLPLAPALSAGAGRAVPELLAPAGDWECARAAVENGADAIYFGLDRFNARMRANNFTEADLPPLMEFLHRRGVRGYVTFNTLVFQHELSDATQYLRAIIAAGVDAVIVQDVGLCRLIRQLSPDFPIHASTQMTITSAAGVEFARELGCQLVVLARECSIAEIERIQSSLRDASRSALPAAPLPLEVFVHGALCVAYSGQCLTSESLGGRSANRGECAQACRLPYDLFSDGRPVPLGDRRYLLSPQDLSGLPLVPELARVGVASLKIEGRLKSPEYVANVTRVYRAALDRVGGEWLPDGGWRMPAAAAAKPESAQYDLEMAFSRGLFTGWLGGVDNQALVHARFGKKRGVYLGQVTRVGRDHVWLRLEAPLKPGDGVVFDAGRPEEDEQGGRVYELRGSGEVELRFGTDAVDFSRVHVGDRLWKTSDPELERGLRQTFTGDTPRFLRPLDFEVHGVAGGLLTLLVRDEEGHVVRVDSVMPLAVAEKQPLTTERLREQLGRLGGTAFQLGELRNELPADVLLPVSELNRLRREAVAQIENLRARPPRWTLLPESPERRTPVRPGPLVGETKTRAELEFGAPASALLTVGADVRRLAPADPQSLLTSAPTVQRASPGEAELIVLVRTLPQLAAALGCGVRTLYCEFEDPKRYREAVRCVREAATCAAVADRSAPEIWVAPPRVFKPGEEWILQQVRSAGADGYLVRNHEHLRCFADTRRLGDYSLNVANRLTADYFLERHGLERVTASYDLNFIQLEAFLAAGSAERVEVTIHQHIPMFHMEHCVFCAFLSTGKDYRDCGRPCDKHVVELKDRVGARHPLKADAGCRNTVFNSQAQTGAEYVERMRVLGVRWFRVEFLNESPEEVRRTVAKYRQLLRGEISGSQLWRELRLQNQLGVTRGQMAREDRQTALAAVKLAREW
jgi:putative protease